MTARGKTQLCLILLSILSFLAIPASAGLLDTGTPYNGWSGTTTFPVPPDPVLSGYIEWAVYAPGQFPFSGYSPPGDEFTYVYQVFCTGTAAISNYSVFIDNAAGNIGAFSDLTNGVTGDAPNSPMTLIVPGTAGWDFDGIVTDGHSCGLVYSSLHTPMNDNAFVINHGQFQMAFAVPSPSPNYIPEPATLWLLASGLGLAVARFWLRRR